MKKAVFIAIAAVMLVSAFSINAPKAEACTMIGCGVYGSDYYVNWFGMGNGGVQNAPMQSYQSYPMYGGYQPSYYSPAPSYYPQQQWGYQQPMNYPQQSYGGYQTYPLEDQWYYEPYGYDCYGYYY